jgi:hypothetical protein
MVAHSLSCLPPDFCGTVGTQTPPHAAEVNSTLDICFIHTLPVLAASRHSRESGNPEGKSQGDWMPACAGMTFSWRRTCETDI